MNLWPLWFGLNLMLYLHINKYLSSLFKGISRKKVCSIYFFSMVKVNRRRYCTIFIKKLIFFTRARIRIYLLWISEVHQVGIGIFMFQKRYETVFLIDILIPILMINFSEIIYYGKTSFWGIISGKLLNIFSPIQDALSQWRK